MLELGGMVASAVLKVVTKQICSAIAGDIKLQGAFKKNLAKMKMTLESVEALLKDAERRSIQDAAVCLWLKRLKNALYDIYDMIDEFDASTKPAEGKLLSLVPDVKICSRISMSNKMKKMREELENITNQHQHFSFKIDNSSFIQTVPDERETDSYLKDQTLIVGRMEEKKKVIGTLSESMTQEVVMLPIYGIGGIGKTTLAKQVFNDARFKCYKKVWIYVSEIFDLNKIGNSIISQLSKEESHITQKQIIHNRLGELLAVPEKKIMIVLDDLWENDDFQLEELKAMLKVGEGGNVMTLVTTRDEHIARKICTVEPYKLPPLTDEMCWDIIKRKSDFEARDDKVHLKRIGKDIAMKCAGVALAAQTLGYMLKPLTFSEWESVANNDIWTASTSESWPHHNVLACLLLSYRSMPPQLKLCFAFCAIFPKGQKIVKDDIIYQWIALDLIGPSDMFSARQLCENYIKQLLGMSFLQHAKPSSPSGMRDDYITLFTMHDLVHDLARTIATDEVLDARKMNIGWNKTTRFALLTDCSKPLKLSVTSPAKIKALHFLGCGCIGFNGTACISAKYLRVLDLNECSIPNLPYSLWKLKRLSYLNAPGVQEQVTPKCLTKLSRLIYLNLHGSSIISLPESIGEMKCLMHLDLSCCSQMEELPKSFVKLKMLVHLDLSQCPKMDIAPEQIVGLKELVFLDLPKCISAKGIAEAVGGLTKLQYLNLAGGDSGCERHCMMSERPPSSGLSTAIGKLMQLRYVGLRECVYYTFDTAILDGIGTLCNLEHLDLSQNTKIRSIPESIGNLRKLSTLNFSGCARLKNLPENIIKMDSLTVLDVKGCSILDRSKLSRSKFFALLPHFVVHACDSESSSNLGQLQHTNPNELEISSLENVKSSEEAQSIELMEKKRIEKLKLEWSKITKRYVEDIEVLAQLVPPSALKEFEIRGYKNARLPAWVMDISHCLPNLVAITMSDLPKCKSLPQLGQLPNLRKLVIRGMRSITIIDEDFCGGPRAFRNLMYLELRHMENLVEWNTTHSNGDGVEELMSANLQRLTVRDCPMLWMRPCPPKAIHWDIKNSENVMSSCGVREFMRASSSFAEANSAVTYTHVLMHRFRSLHQIPALSSQTISRSTISHPPVSVPHRQVRTPKNVL